MRVIAVKGKMAELAKECADERHVANFALGDEMVVHAESGHQDEHIGIAGVVGDEHTRVAAGKMLAPAHLHPAAGQREIHAKRRRGNASSCATARRQIHSDPARHDPHGEKNQRVDS